VSWISFTSISAVPDKWNEFSPCQNGGIVAYAGRDAASRLPLAAAPLPRARCVQHARRQLRPAVERDAADRDSFPLLAGRVPVPGHEPYRTWQFAYLVVAIRRFYLAAGRWGGRLLSVAAAMLIYVANGLFMTAVQLGGAAVALALA
jgi:hypothetical protein